MFKTLFSILIWPIWFAVLLICIFALMIALLIIPIQQIHYFMRIISRIILFAGGQILIVQGPVPKPEKGPYLYLFNHESMFDVFILSGSIPQYFTAVGANYQFAWPIWGFILRRYGIIPIKRKTLGIAIQSLSGAEESIRKGVSFLISPEGTRTLSGELGPFKKGPFHVAKNTGITIIPMGIKGAFAAKPKQDWRIKPGILKLRFGDPILHQNYEHLSVEELRDVIREKIVKLL